MTPPKLGMWLKNCLWLFILIGPQNRCLASLKKEPLTERDLPTFTCGEETIAGEFNFVSPAYPVSVGTSNLTCKLTINHGCPVSEENTICQLRLDFTEMIMQPPLLGTCRFDKFFTTANGRYPLLCGENSGQHMYVDVGGRASSDLTFLLADQQSSLYNCPDKFGMFQMPKSDEMTRGLDFDLEPDYGRVSPEYWMPKSDEMTRGLDFDLEPEPETENDNSGKAGKPGPSQRGTSGNPVVKLPTSDQTPEARFPTRRAWKIKVTQIPCGCSSQTKAPDGCTQYYSGISGSIKSFNYDQVGCFSNDHVCDANQMEACDLYAGYTGQLNNLDYTVCIEQEYGFCGTEYYQASEAGSFSLSNSTNLNENFQDSTAEGARNGAKCVADYIVLPGGQCKNDKTHYSSDRFCGNSLGVMGMRQPIISYSRPFMFQVVTDSDELTQSSDYMNRGFHLKYHQLPCSSNF